MTEKSGEEMRAVIDKAAIRSFKNDLAGMTREQMQKAFDEVSDTIDRETEWQEALAAGMRALDRGETIK